MDPLTQTVALLRPTALKWKLADAHGHWAVRYPANAGVAFCLVAAGQCDYRLAGHPKGTLAEGDCLLVTAPPDWTLGRGDDTAAPVDFQAVHGGPGEAATRIGHAARDEGPLTRVLGGHFSFGDANADLLAGLLPTVVHLRSAEAPAGRLRALISLIGDEAASDRAGRALVLDRLLEVMLIEAIRHAASRSGDGAQQGLVRGLADAQIAPALRAMHADVRRAWTVAALAAEVHMSRSVFAARFRRAVGVAPIDYLLQWRMALARDALRTGASRLSEIAFDCGYQSVSAFSAAFSRTVGCSPAAYAARHDGATSPPRSG